MTKAKKSFGQHFLKEERIAERIAAGLLLTDTYPQVVEVGPGMGMLTKYLLEKPYRLTVVEADKDMVEYLSKAYPNLQPHIIHNDILKVRFEEYLTGQFCVIGNFPYNISSQILFKVLAYKEQVPEVVGMFQKEMADRVASKPGGKEYGVISVLVQAFYEVETLMQVKPGSFNPPPKVNSAVIRLQRRPNLDLGCDHTLFKRIVKVTFNQRRKMLRNTLREVVGNASLLHDAFFELRPEKLSVADFVTITNQVAQYLADPKDAIPPPAQDIQDDNDDNITT